MHKIVTMISATVALLTVSVFGKGVTPTPLDFFAAPTTTLRPKR